MEESRKNKGKERKGGDLGGLRRRVSGGISGREVAGEPSATRRPRKEEEEGGRREKESISTTADIYSS